MEYELRVVVEKVLVSTQEVVKRDTLKTYDVKPPESILELGLRHEEQISLIGKVQDAILAVQAKLIDPGHDVCPRCGDKLKNNRLRVFRTANTAHLAQFIGICSWSKLVCRERRTPQ